MTSSQLSLFSWPQSCWSNSPPSRTRCWSATQHSCLTSNCFRTLLAIFAMSIPASHSRYSYSAQPLTPHSIPTSPYAQLLIAKTLSLLRFRAAAIKSRPPARQRSFAPSSSGFDLGNGLQYRWPACPLFASQAKIATFESIFWGVSPRAHLSRQILSFYKYKASF